MTSGGDESDQDRPDGPSDTPVQIATPEGWPAGSRDAPKVPVRMGAPLGERPLPDLQPLGEEGATVPPRKARSRKRKPLLRRLLVGVVKLIVALVLLSVLWVAAYRFVPPPITLTMIGNMIEGHGARRDWEPLERIDPDMARAVIAGEDSRFCSHDGFDFEAIRQAWERNRQGGRIRGGSTISQQTAKNVFLWQGGGYFRKALEAYFTVLIEAIWGKRRIMEVYLNVAETGIGTFGVEAGAQRYFRHGANRLSRQEAAQIAAVLPLPKKRAGIAPTGFTRRWGNTIRAGIGTIEAQGLDACLR